MSNWNENVTKTFKGPGTGVTVKVNGVKQYVPFGEEVTVPAPIAEKVEEFLAGVQWHTAIPARRDITIPTGGTLTLEKGAKFVDNSGTSEVVILQETELTVVDGAANITTPPNQLPEDGATVIVSYNGTDYECKVALVYMEGMQGLIMGNTEALGIAGGNADAPFVVAFLQADIEGVYGSCMSMDGATTVTLSIVQVGAASGGSAGGVVTATAVTGDGPSVTSIDKTYSELLSAVKAGKYVQMMAKIGTSIIAVPFVFWMEEGDSGYMLFSVQAKAIAATIQYNADGTAEWAQ